MTSADDFLPAPPAMHRRAPMLYVSLLIEALRARPRAMFWFATLSQAILWTLAPSIFYAAPPVETTLVLAVGREWLLGSPYGPPLAYWAAEAAFSLADGRMLGVYLLSQLCMVVTFWAVFAVGRSMLGNAHALMAVLLMTGILSFSVPTPEFGPSVLATPLTALTLYHYWRAVNDGKTGHWFALAWSLGLLVLTTYAGLILLALVVVFTAATERARATLGSIDPWAAALVVVLFVFPHLAWLESVGALALPSLADLPDLRAAQDRYPALLKLVLWLLVAHAGFLMLIVVGGLRIGPQPPAPAFERSPVDSFAKKFVYFFALAPAAATLPLAVLFEQGIPVGGAAPLIVFSGLAAILAAGDSIRLYRQRSLGLAWLSLLLVPAGVTAFATAALPWIGVDLYVGRPAASMGQFFTESFRRRTGKPLEIVIGDVRTGGLVAAASADRPHLFVDASRERAPWIGDAAIRDKGAVLVWHAADPSGAPPDWLKAQFPDLVPEIPRSFERPIQGRLPLFRVGWAMIRPASGAEQPRGELRGSQPAQ